MKKLFILLLFFLVLTSKVKPQSFISFGISSYEKLNIGFSTKLGVNNYQVTVGIKPALSNITGNFALSGAVFWNKTSKYSGPRWPIYLLNRVTYWEVDNDFYHWKVITGSFGVGGRFYIFKKTGIICEFAPTINYVLSFERKTFEKIGWPNLFGLNYGVGIFKEF